MANIMDSSISRRAFLKTTAATSVAAMTMGSAVFAAGSDTIKVGLVGCGGRGTDALDNFIEAAKILNLNVKVVAVADVFRSRTDEVLKRLNLPADIGINGFDAYKKLLAMDMDYVLLATSPNFRPLHLDAAVNAGKHVFMEKPVAIDPPGVRRVIASGERARGKGLAVVAGTQRRHDAEYQKIQYAVANGAIGKITGGSVYWCQRSLWYVQRKPGESDADYMIRNWVSFTETSGDHIVEQHVHNLDVANWFIGRTPRKALGFGSRARRKTGNQYDFFCIEYDYDEGCRIQSMCRQIDGCYNVATESFTGTQGTTLGNGQIQSTNNKKIAIPDFPQRNPYVQEHLDLIKSVIDGKPLNEARQVAQSTLTAVMGRISAYTGQIIRWSDLMETEDSQWYNLTLKPTAEDFENGTVKAPPEDVAAVPGKEKT